MFFRKSLPLFALMVLVLLDCRGLRPRGYEHAVPSGDRRPGSPLSSGPSLQPASATPLSGRPAPHRRCRT